jgi:WD40 repeat protein
MSAKPAPPADRSAAGNPPEHLTDIYLFDLQKWGDEFSPLILKMPSRFPNDVFGELRFSFDGRWLIATGVMQQGYCWDLRADDVGNSRQPLRGPGPSVQAMLPDTREWLSPTARWGIKPTTAAEKYSLELIDFATDRPGTPTETLVADLPVRFHAKPLFSPQERFCAFSSGGVGHESDLLLFELEAGPNSPRRLYLPGNERTWNNPLGFSPDQRWLLHTSTSMNEPMWNIATGRELPSRTILPSIQPFRIVLWSTSLQAPFGKGIELFRGESSSIVTAKFEFCPNNRWLYLVCSSFPEGAYFPEPTREKPQPQFLRADGQPLTQSDFIYELVRFDLTHDDIAASKHVVCKSALRSLISSADGSWVAAGIKDVVQVWKTDQPANDKPWKTLTGNDNLGTHLYRAPHPQKLVSRSYVPEAQRGKRELPREEENARGQCMLWDLSSTSERPVFEFQSTKRFWDDEPIASSDYRWWVSGAEVLDLSTIGPSGPSRMPYTTSDFIQPKPGGGAWIDTTPRSVIILRDRWLLARRWPGNDESYPILLYPLGASPRPLEPRALTSLYASTLPSEQLDMAVSPDGRWVAQGETHRDGLTKEVRIRLVRCGSPTNVEHFITQKLFNSGEVREFNLSPAGRYLAMTISEGVNTRVRVWKLSDNQAPELVLSQDNLPVVVNPIVNRTATLRFSADERWMAVAAGDYSARLFDLTAADIGGTATRLFPVAPNQTHGQLPMPPTSLDFSPDGRWLIAQFPLFRRTVLFDLNSEDKQRSQRSFESHSNPEIALFLDKGTRIVTIDGVGNLLEWDASQLPETLPPVRPIELRANHSSGRAWMGDWLSPNRRYLTFAGGERLAVWDLEKDRTKPTFHLAEQEGRINGLTFSSNSRWLITSCPGRGGIRSTEHAIFVRLWDLESSDPANTSILLPTPDYFRSSSPIQLTVTPDNRFVIAASPSQSIVWTLGLDEIYALARSVTEREMTSDERRLYEVPRSGFSPPDAKLIPRPPMFRGNNGARSDSLASPPPPRPRTRSRDELVTFREHRTAVHKVAISPDGSLVASTCGPIPYHLVLNKATQRYEWNNFYEQLPSDRRVLVWRVSTGQLVREFPAGKDRVLDLCWAPTGNELRWITRNGEVVTGNLADGTLATELIPDDETPFAVFSDSVLTIQPHRSSPLNPESTRELLIQRGLKVKEKLAALREKDWHFKFSGAPQKLPLDYPQSVIARADWFLFDKQAEAWNPGTGARVSLFHEPHNKSVALATRRPAWANGSLVGSSLSPDGTTAFVMTLTGCYLFRFADHSIEELDFPRKMLAPRLAWSPDGNRLALADETLSSAGESILLYSFAEKRIVHSFTGHTGTITCLAFTPDSRQIVSASADGTARVWQLPTAGGKD